MGAATARLVALARVRPYIRRQAGRWVKVRGYERGATPAGDCYEAAGRTILDVPESANPTLVHGLVTGRGPIEGVLFGHAWVETSQRVRVPGTDQEIEIRTVLDNSGGNERALPAELFYALGQVREEDLRRYTKAEASRMMLKQKTYGPWEEPPRGKWATPTSSRDWRSTVELARVLVAPHRRILDGEVIDVDQYWRRLTPSSGRGSVLGRRRSMPAAIDWSVCQVCPPDEYGNPAQLNGWPHRINHYKKHHPGVDPKDPSPTGGQTIGEVEAPEPTPETVFQQALKAPAKVEEVDTEAFVPKPGDWHWCEECAKEGVAKEFTNWFARAGHFKKTHPGVPAKPEADGKSKLEKLKSKAGTKAAPKPPWELKVKPGEKATILPSSAGKSGTAVAKNLSVLRATAEKHGVPVTDDMTKVDIMDAMREALGTFDPNTQVDPAKAQSLDSKVDWTADDPFAGIEKQYLNDQWIAEPKLDGLRMRIFLGKGGNTINTGRRSSNPPYAYHERADNFPYFRDAVLEGEAGTVLDAEIMPPVDSIVTESGVETKGTLNTIMAMVNVNPKTSQASQAKYGKPVLMVFDITQRRGEDVTQLPFEERRAQLEEVMQHLSAREPAFQIIYQMPATGDNVRKALDMGFEGVILKRKGHKYQPGKRMDSWQKIKRLATGEFYVIGSVPGKGSNAGKVGSLKVAYRGKDGDDVYVADVAGFTEAIRAELTDPDTGEVRKEFLGRVLEVAAQGRTKNDRLRHPRFVRWRSDKKPEDTDEDQLKINFTPT